MTLADVPYKTSVFSGFVNVGDTGIRMVGVVWLAAAVTYLIAGVALAMGASWSVPLASVITIISVALCLSAWPEARLGLAVNVALLLALLPMLARP
jgi:hypothetical protein